MNDQLHPNPGTPDAGRHAGVPAPLEGVMRGLDEASRAPSATLDQAKKAALRADLLAHASRAMSATPTPAKTSAPPVSPTPAPRRPWFLWMGAFAAVAAVLVVAFVAAPNFRSGGKLGPVGSSPLARLQIPEAHAGDAFSLYAETSDAAGMDAASAIIVKSTVDITKEQLAQTLRIVPAVEVEVAKTDASTFKITPKDALEPGAVYQVTLAADVKQPDGTVQTRDFRWALQTKNDLRVLSSIPGDRTGYVPVNTGIEFKMTYADLENVKASFSISPEVRGRFETYGRTVVFIPEKPLKNGTLYEVRLKKGLKVKGSTLALAEDKVVTFETERDWSSVNQKPRFQVWPTVVVGTNRDIFLQSWQYPNGVPATTPVEVTAYTVTPEESAALLRERADVPGFAAVAQERTDAYQKYAKNKAFTLTVNGSQPEVYGQIQLVLPAQKTPGRYVVKLLPKDGEATWFLLQVTDHATYFLGDKTSLQAWVVNASTNKVWPGQTISADTLTATTDANGVATLPAARLNSTSSEAVNGDKPYFLMQVGSGADVYQAILSKGLQTNQYGYYGVPYGMSPYENAVSQLQVDRPIYHPTDEVKFSGLAQNRDSHQGLGTLSVQLTRGDYYWDWFGNEKVYREQTATSDAKGFYEGTVPLNDLSSGYYALRIMKDGKVVTSRSFEVREFKKPTYALDLTTDAKTLYVGQEVTGNVVAKFYDGTPLVKAKLTLNVYVNAYGWYEGIPPQQTLTLTTDDAGRATFRVPSGDVECGPNVMDYCASSKEIGLVVKPADGEEADIVGSANVTAYATDLTLRLEPHTSSTQATVVAVTSRGSLDQEKEPVAWGGRPVHAFVRAAEWVKIEDGTYYDFFSKKVVPRYRYEQVFRPEKDASFDVVTGADGKAAFSFPMEPQYQYQVYLESTDDKGRKVRLGSWYYAIGYYDYTRWGATDQNVSYYGTWEDTQPQLQLEGGKDFYAEGQKVSMRYQIGKQPLDISKTPGVLYNISSRGLRKNDFRTSNLFDFTFDNALLPGTTVRGITFKDGQFLTAYRAVSIDYSSRALEVQVTPDREQYAPGTNAEFKVSVKEKATGQPVPNARITLSAIDKSIEAVATNGFPAEDPLSQLNQYAGDGITLDMGSHSNSPVLANGYGGAEKGGGGGGDVAPMAARALVPQAGSDVRKIFKDTAAFVTATTNEAGTALVKVTWPDNLTSWRTEVTAIAPDLKAGDKIEYVPVTRPVFVDVVAPPRLLTTDKPVLKLRAYGVGLQGAANVSFVVDAPSLGIMNQTVTGTAFVASYVAIDKLVPGTHTVTLRVSTPSGTDALERKVTIVDTRFTKDEEVTVEAGPGVGLPDIGTKRTTVLFVSKAQGSFLPQVRDLSSADWSPRVDAQVASRLMKQLLVDLYKEKDVVLPTETLSDYQDPSGEMKLFPYGSGDPELSGEIAATMPGAVNRDALKAAFYAAMENRGASRETQVNALAGLAALGEPVLPSLQAMAAQTDLDWREQLTLARGFVGIGAQEDAGKLLDALLQKKQVRGTVAWLNVSDRLADNYGATADAAALAASLARPDAEPLMAYVMQNWSDESFPLLAKARYLAKVAPMRPAQDVSLSYTLDSKTEQTISLKEWPTERKEFTAEEAKNFRVTKVNGPVVMNFVKRVSGRPATKPELSVSRSYETPDKRPLNDLREGDVVKVNLTVEWQPQAIDWCYALRDHLPGAFEATASPSYGPFDLYTWYPYRVENGEASFVVCKDTKPRTVTYYARVVARGTYTAEAPVVQHVEHPSVSAIGKDQAVTVK